MIDVRFAHALQIMTALARAKESRILLNSTELGRMMNAHATRVRYVLAPLARAGLIESLIGSGGGVKLIVSPSRITFKEIYTVVAEDKPFVRDRKNIAQPKSILSNIESAFVKVAFGIESSILEYLDKIKLSDILIMQESAEIATTTKGTRQSISF